MSGWRAGAVALAVGGVILAAGWYVGRPAPADAGPVTTAAGEVVVDEALVLACAEVLAPACSEVAAAIGVATTRWQPGDEPPERGAVLAPAGDLPEADAPPSEVAVSPIVVSGWLSRWQPLEADCGGAVDVECLSARLGSAWAELGAPAGWGEVTLGLADPTLSEAGMGAWSLLVPALGPDGLGGALRITADDDADLMEEFVRVGDSRANFALATEVAVIGQFDNAIGRGGRLQLAYPARGPQVTYAAAPLGRGGGDLVAGLLEEPARAAFGAAGLRPAGGLVGTPHQAMGEPGEATPLPDAATRATLSSSWDELS